MKKQIRISIIYILLCNFLFVKSYCQSIEDSIMTANSEKWNIDYKKGTFTLSQPGLDQTFTMNLIKLDSGKIKQKRKDSSDVEFSGSEGFDHFKYMTIKKSKLYTLQLGNDENATTALISVSSESNEKRQTFLGKMLSKNDEGKNEVVNYTRNVSGIIKRYNSASLWKFNLDNLTGTKNTDELPFLITSPVTGFLKNEKDSLFLELASFKADALLANNNGDHLAAVKFKKRPFIMWIRKDIDNSLQDAIAVFFGVMIGMKEK